MGGSLPADVIEEVNNLIDAASEYKNTRERYIRCRPFFRHHQLVTWSRGGCLWYDDWHYAMSEDCPYLHLVLSEKPQTFLEF